MIILIYVELSRIRAVISLIRTSPRYATATSVHPRPSERLGKIHQSLDICYESVTWSFSTE